MPSKQGLYPAYAPRRANAVIAAALVRGEPCSINTIALCELVWVLRDAYGSDKPTIVTTLSTLLDTPRSSSGRRILPATHWRTSAAGAAISPTT